MDRVCSYGSNSNANDECRLHRVGDPTYDEREEGVGYMVCILGDHCAVDFGQIAQIIVVIVSLNYLGWLAYAVGKSWWHVRDLGSRFKVFGMCAVHVY